MTRIGFADHLFLRMHHGIGHPVYNQFLWRFDDSIESAELVTLHRELSLGLLNRQVESPIVPTARHRWIASRRSHELQIDSQDVDPDRIREWASRCITPGGVTSDMDPERGLGWKLSASPLRGGGTVVSLACSHMVADGAALIAAVRAAHGAVSGQPLDARPDPIRTVLSDLSDSAREVVPIVRWAVHRIQNSIPGLRTPTAAPEAELAAVPGGLPRAEPPTRSSPPQNDAAWSPPFVVAEVDSSRWIDAATKSGGTSSSLLVAVLTEIARLGGRATSGDQVVWSLPVSARLTEDGVDADNRSNSTKIVKVAVPVGTDAAVGDLSATRRAMKSAFVDYSAREGAHPPDALPLQLVQILPDVIVAALPRPKDNAEGLCSNLGVLPDDFTVIGGSRARSVVAHASFVGIDAPSARDLGGGLTAWATDTGTAVTLCIHGMDPDRFTGDHELEKFVSAALGTWGLDARFW